MGLGDVFGAVSGLASGGPSAAKGDALGSPVSVGGLTINKRDDAVPLVIAAALAGAALVWVLRR